MEIDSDSDQNPQISSTKETPLSDIALPPTTCPNSNSSIRMSYPRAKACEVLQFVARLLENYFRNF